MTFTIEQLQLEVTEWSRRNFNTGPQNAAHKLMGIVEEVGELIEALDGYTTLRNPWGGTSSLASDAIADILIYSADYCGCRDWFMGRLDVEAIGGSAATPMSERNNEEEAFADIDWNLRELSMCVGRLCHHQLKSEQGIRDPTKEHNRCSQAQMVRLFRTLRRLCSVLGFDYIKTVETVWLKVKQRDWKKDSATAGGHV